MKREGLGIARCTVERLMQRLGLQGVRRGKVVRTTTSDMKALCPLDRVNRIFKADRPNQLWVSDFTYVSTWQGWLYVAFAIHVYARRIVGWRVSSSMHTDFVLDALEQALYARQPERDGALIHHSDRGLQYCSNEYQRILTCNLIQPSMTQNSDPYENAVAERINGILKQEIDIDKYNLDPKNKRKQVQESIEIYNTLRPHYSNHYLTPNQMHQQQKLKIKTYKNKNQGKNVFALV